jgi:hypothetical protein
MTRSRDPGPAPSDTEDSALWQKAMADVEDLLAFAANLAFGLEDDLAHQIEAAPLPEGDSQGEWVANVDAQIGRLDTANRNGAAGLNVIAKCEERDKKAAERLSGPFWRRWLGG